jgi:hypothetical protein
VSQVWSSGLGGTLLPAVVVPHEDEMGGLAQSAAVIGGRKMPGKRKMIEGGHSVAIGQNSRWCFLE